MKNDESGRSLMEMIGVIALIMVLTIAGFMGYQKAMNRLKIKKTTDQISTIVTSIRTFYLQQETYGGLNNESAVNMTIIPIEMGSDENLVNPFMGGVKIGSARLYESDTVENGKSFFIIYDGLNRQACVDLASADWSGKGVNLVGIGIFGKNHSFSDIETIAQNLLIDNTGYKGDYGIATLHSNILNIPVPITEAATLCSCDRDSTECKLFWKYY